MTHFRFEHEFRGEAADYWKIFFDPECMKIQYGRTGVRSFEVVELLDEPDTIIRTVRVVPARDLPAAIRKLTGASFGYEEKTTFVKAAGYADTVVTPTSLANRIQIGGRHTAEPTGPGRVTRVFEGDLSVDIKLIGKRIEKTIFDDMARSYDAGAEITQAWLDERS